MIRNEVPGTSMKILPSWAEGGSLLYLASAVCMLIGTAQILVPVYAEPANLEKFWCLLVMAGYEWVLLGVTLIVTRWARVLDDGVGLTIMIALFLSAFAAGLTTIAPEFKATSLWLGVGAVLMLLPRFWLLQRHVTGRWSVHTLAGIAAVMTWSYFVPGVVSWFGQTRAEWNEPMIWVAWSAAGAILIVAMSVLVSSAWCLPARVIGEPEPDVFLHGRVMRWIVIDLLLIGVALQQHAVAWGLALTIRHSITFGVYLAAGAWLAMGHLREWGVSRDRPYVIVASAPFVWVLWMFAADKAIANLPADEAVKWVTTLAPPWWSHRWFVAITMTLPLSVFAWKRRSAGLGLVAVAYALSPALDLRASGISASWLLVALAFAMLAAGAGASVLKGVRRRAESIAVATIDVSREANA